MTPTPEALARALLAPFSPFVITHNWMRGGWDETLDNVACALTERAREIERLTEALQDANRHTDRLLAYSRTIGRATWAAAATVAEDIARLYAETDESGTDQPTDDTCAAVACAVNIATEMRARAAAQGGTG